MTCAACGGALSQRDPAYSEAAGVRSGRFVEEYECATCGMSGRIEGEAGASPDSWSRVGVVFEA